MPTGILCKLLHGILVGFFILSFYIISGFIASGHVNTNRDLNKTVSKSVLFDTVSTLSNSITKF